MFDEQQPRRTWRRPRRAVRALKQAILIGLLCAAGLAMTGGPPVPAVPVAAGYASEAPATPHVPDKADNSPPTTVAPTPAGPPAPAPVDATSAPAAPAPDAPPDPAAVLAAVIRRSDASADPAERVRTRLVSIHTTRARTISIGTGMIITSSGRVLTNNHVVQDAQLITATLGATGATYRARLVGADPDNDVAVLQLVGASGLPTVTIGSDSAISPGSPVLAVGNAAHGGGVLTSTPGVVTELGHSLVAGNPGHPNEVLSNLIVFAGSIEAGDSGGPLIDNAGEVIGLVTAGEPTAAGMVGYAIPISTAIAIAFQFGG